jgi:hypothetical protein
MLRAIHARAIDPLARFHDVDFAVFCVRIAASAAGPDAGLIDAGLIDVGRRVDGVFDLRFVDRRVEPRRAAADARSADAAAPR